MEGKTVLPASSSNSFVDEESCDDIVATAPVFLGVISSSCISIAGPAGPVLYKFLRVSEIVAVTPLRKPKNTDDDDNADVPSLTNVDYWGGAEYLTGLWNRMYVYEFDLKSGRNIFGATRFSPSEIIGMLCASADQQDEIVEIEGSEEDSDSV